MKALIIAASLIQLLTWLPRKVLHVIHVVPAAIDEEIGTRAMLLELWLERKGEKE
ncbi:MAG: hypothetical protein KC652_18390 [Cyanobacteria bacterium HKST-UBA01]|nr:hypothetical protein [Cyanobacteria bacterium HKST-UBA01]